MKVKGKYHQKIRETEIDGEKWQVSHWNSIKQNYRRAPYFDEVSQWLKPLYLDETHTMLAKMNRRFIEAVCDYLMIKTQITNSWDYELIDGKTERLADICRQAGAGEYISGPSAQNYVDPDVFKHMNIKLTWFDYSHYPVYDQLWGEFEHGVSILDLLFNCGKDTATYHPKKS